MKTGELIRPMTFDQLAERWEYELSALIRGSKFTEISESAWNESLLASVKTYQSKVFDKILGECRRSITANTWNKAFIASIDLMERAFSYGANQIRESESYVKILHQVYQWPQSSDQSSWMLKIIEEAPNEVITQRSWEEAKGGSCRIDKLKIAFVTSILAKKPAVTDKILANVPEEKLSDYWNSAFASMSFSDKPEQILWVLGRSGNMITRENLESTRSIYQESFHHYSTKESISTAIGTKLSELEGSRSGAFVSALKAQRAEVGQGAASLGRS